MKQSRKRNISHGNTAQIIVKTVIISENKKNYSKLFGGLRFQAISNDVSSATT